MAKEFLKVRSGVGLKPGTAPGDPENGDYYYDSGTNSFKFRENGTWTSLGGTNTATPIWTKYTTTHTSLQAAALTNHIELFSLPIKGMIHQVIVKHNTAFAGSGITSYNVSVGISTNFNKYTTNFDVAQSVSNTARSITQAEDVESFTGTTSIRLKAISTGANLDQSSAGSVEVWVLTSILP